MADGVTFNSREVVALQHRLNTSAAQVRARAAVVVRAAGLMVERDAKVACPVDTGYLRSSISSRMSGNATTARAEVSAAANYAIWVEHGTSRMAPQPFLLPAFERNKQPFIEALRQMVDGTLG